MKIKRISFLLVALIAVISLAGCGSDKETAAPEDAQPDVVTKASEAVDEATLLNAIKADGEWIILLLNDISIDKELVLEGEFRDKDNPENDLFRKLALYAQDASRKVTARYTLTAPKLTVKSPNTRIQGGTVVGDVYVENNGFNIVDAKIEGNLYFAKQEYKDSATVPDGSVTGVVGVL